MFGLRKKVDEVIAMVNLHSKRLKALENHLSITYNPTIEAYDQLPVMDLGDDRVRNVKVSDLIKKPKKRGRPKGSKNKATRRVGRPKGSKNKPK